MVLGELSEENKEDNYCNRKTYYFDFKLYKAFISEKLLSKKKLDEGFRLCLLKYFQARVRSWSMVLVRFKKGPELTL